MYFKESKIRSEEREERRVGWGRGKRKGRERGGGGGEEEVLL